MATKFTFDRLAIVEMLPVSPVVAVRLALVPKVTVPLSVVASFNVSDLRFERSERVERHAVQCRGAPTCMPP